MKYSLADFKGRYHSMPNAIMDLLSGDAFLVFARIYAHSKQTLCEGDIQISAKTLSKLVRRSERKVAQSIKELEDIGFVFVRGSERGKRTYTINWDEIYNLDQFTSSITYDGVAKLNELCHPEGSIIPFSKVPRKVLAEISADFKYDGKSAANFALSAENAADSTTTRHKSADISALKAENAADSTNLSRKSADISESADISALKDENAADLVKHNHKSAANFALSAENAADWVTLMQKCQQITCNQSSHFVVQEQKQCNLYVILSGAEQIIAENLGIGTVTLVKSAAFSALNDVSSQKSAAFSAKSAAFLEKSADISALKGKNLLTFEHPEYIYNKYNKNINIYGQKEILNQDKDDLGLDSDSSLELKPETRLENSQQSSKEIEAVRDWFGSRDLTLPAIDSLKLEQIMNDPDKYNNDSDEIIRYVMDCVGFSEMEDFGPFYVLASNLKKYIANAWLERKEIKGDEMNLSEQDAKNIFGFDLFEEPSGELLCFVDPSKLRDISVSTSQGDKQTRVRNDEDRRSRVLFIDSILEIADLDVEKLSAAEYAILLMMDYVKDRADNNQVRPDEITKSQYKDLLNEFSEKSGVPFEDLSKLWKEIPQKGKVRLSAIQLLPNKIFQYNHQYNDQNSVEELYNKKMAEEG